MHYRDVIVRPIVTEKTTYMSDVEGQFVFEVHPKANKLLIKDAIEQIWPKVDVVKVRVINMPAKRARRWRKMIIRKKSWKKAIVTLAPGQRIEMFEGV